MANADFDVRDVAADMVEFDLSQKQVDDSWVGRLVARWRPKMKMLAGIVGPLLGCAVSLGLIQPETVTEITANIAAVAAATGALVYWVPNTYVSGNPGANRVQRVGPPDA